MPEPLASSNKSCYNRRDKPYQNDIKEGEARMIAIVCIDGSGGMLFNRRRQSQDRLLREDLLREAEGRTLWMNAYSAKQFKTLPETVRTAEDFLDQAGNGDLCFVEDRDPACYAGQLEGLIVYRWNRNYPADLFFTVPLEDWTLSRQAEFAGSSHEKITKEVYTK